MKEQNLIREGLINESLLNGMFQVRLENENIILGYVRGGSGTVLSGYYQGIESKSK